jgi:hypothetical protein
MINGMQREQVMFAIQDKLAGMAWVERIAA